MSGALPADAVVGVVGAGTMGAAHAAIARALDMLVGKQRLTAAEASSALARLLSADDVVALAPARLVIEAVPEDMAIKHAVPASTS